MAARFYMTIYCNYKEIKEEDLKMRAKQTKLFKFTPSRTLKRPFGKRDKICSQCMAIETGATEGGLWRKPRPWSRPWPYL